MEAAKHLLPSPPLPPCPPPAHLTTYSFSSSSSPPPSSTSSSPSALILHEQQRPAITTISTVSSARCFPASVLIQEQREESKLLCHLVKEDKVSQDILERRLMGTPSSANKGSENLGSDQYMNNFRLQMLQLPGLWYLIPSLQSGEPTSGPVAMPSGLSKSDKELEPQSVITLAKQALSASREAVSLAEASKSFEAGLSDSLGPSLVNVSVEERIVRSTRLLQRRSKKRRIQKPGITDKEDRLFERPDAHRKISESIDQTDPLRLFLSCGETKLLTAKEERELIEKIQDLMKLEEVKNHFHGQFAREPTLIEWAEAVGVSCQSLQAELRSGKSSREKLIYANFRMVVHIAKQYQGRGLSLPDLLQEGSMGLMKSVEKFKPQAGCRFATYAYWWIRQAIRKAIFQHSRTIRLPENVYALLSKVREAKKLCIQHGQHQPTKEEIAECAGITVEKLDKLLFTARMPLSLQQPVWTDQDTIFQEITADNSIEVPDVSVSKQLMRQHMRSLLNVLSPKERKIIQLRFGIKDGKQRSLSEIGIVFGLSKERVRQLESRALYKLKQHLGSHGLGAYEDLLI